MARYFFNFEDGKSSVPDWVGQDLPDPVAARGEAAKLAADVAMNLAVEGRSAPHSWIEVCDEHQRPIARFPVNEAIRGPSRLS